MKRRPQHRSINPAVWEQVIAANRDTPTGTVTDVMTKLHDAFTELRGGSVDDDLFDRLASCINVGLVRAEQIDPVCATPMVAARDALMRCDGIRGRHGRYGFDGPGLHAMATGLDVYEEILRNSTPQQMAEAALTSYQLTLRQVAAESLPA